MSAFLPRAGSEVALLEVDGRFVGWLTQLRERDILYVDVCFLAGRVGEERFDDAALLVLRDGGVRQRRIEEEQRIRIIPLNGGPEPAEMERHEPCQEVPQLRALRFVRRSIVSDCLGPADGVDPNHQRLHVRVLGSRAEVQREQAESHQRDEDERDLQIRVHDERGAVQLDELALRVLQGLRVHVGYCRGHCRSLPQRMEMEDASNHPHDTENQPDQGCDADKRYVGTPKVLPMTSGDFSLGKK